MEPAHDPLRCTCSVAADATGAPADSLTSGATASAAMAASANMVSGSVGSAAQGGACPGCRARALRDAARAELLSGLSRRRAPVGLDALVQASLHTAPLERALSRLPRYNAPAVLERLVAEEIASPLAASVRRAVGGLPKQRAPGELFASIDLAPRHTSRRVAGVVAAAMGAVALTIVVWIARPPAASEVVAAPGTAISRADRPPLRLQVVHATSLAELDPLARAFAESLAGGMPVALITPQARPR